MNSEQPMLHPSGLQELGDRIVPLQPGITLLGHYAGLAMHAMLVKGLSEFSMDINGTRVQLSNSDEAVKAAFRIAEQMVEEYERSMSDATE